MRWIIGAAVTLAVLVLLGLGLLAMIPAERVALAISDQFERATGRKMVLSGEVTPRLWPSLGVSTGPVSIANADWAEGDDPLFRAENLSVEVNFSALLGGEVKILGLVADVPEINLERAADGRQNWVFDASGAGAVPAAATAFTLDQGRITDGRIRFVDHATGRTIALEAVDATLAIPDFSGPFTLSATGLSRGQAVTLDLSGGVYSAFSSGAVVPLALDLNVGGSSIAFEGRGGYSPMAIEGALQAELADLPALGALLGTELAKPGAGLGKDRLDVAGQLTLDGTGAAFLRGAEIVADGNQVRGDLDLRPGDARPKLSGKLSAGPIVIGTGPDGESGGGQAGGMAADGWPEGVIDVSALGTMDAAIELSAPSVNMGVLKLGETQALITIERSRAVIDIRRMAAYDGQITGDFVVNGRGGLSVGGRLTFAGLKTQPLMADLAGWDRLVSTGDLELEFLGVGNSINEIMSGLEGEGTLELGQGTLRGIDVVSMLRTLDPGYVGQDQKTAFEGLAGTFVIDGGVLSNSDLKLVAPYLTASGSGQIGLGTRTLNYRIRPTALAAEDGTGGVMVPLLITGSWADPTFRLDLESIAREKMEAEAKAAEARAKAEAKAAEERAKVELEQRLRDELGVEVAPDESLGDAAVGGAQEALEEEARRALEDILRGN